MPIGIYEKDDVDAVANAIRNNLGNDTKYTVGQMPSAIDEIQVNAYNNGHSEGKTEAYAEVDPINAELERTLYGTDTGGKSFYDAFWNSYQAYGERTTCDFMFAGNSWSNYTIKPKYDIKPTRANNMFSMTYFSGDLAQHFENLGIVLDFSNCTMATQIFVNNYNLTRIGILDFRKVTSGTGWFQNCRTLNTIDKLILSEKSVVGITDFNACAELVNITIEGLICMNWSFQWCTKLSHDSLMSIINALRDNSGTSTWNSIALGADNLAKLTQDELDIMERKQWEYS